MTTDDAVRTRTDLWGRPLHDGAPALGPPDVEGGAWPAAPMLVLGDDDVVTCAALFARAFTSELFCTIWCLVLDDQGWATRAAAELLDIPRHPPDRGVHDTVAEITTRLGAWSPGCSVVVAIADPWGGDRGAREVAWTRALLAAAEDTGLRVRGIVAVGAYRARLLYSAGCP